MSRQFLQSPSKRNTSRGYLQVYFFCFALLYCFLGVAAAGGSVYTAAREQALLLLTAADDSPEKLDRSAVLATIRAALSGGIDASLLKTVTDELLIGEASAGGVVSERCSADLTGLLAAVIRGERWAIEYADSAGKLPPGLLNGATTWLGSFDQCLQATSGPAGTTGNASSRMVGAYCLLKLNQWKWHPSKNKTNSSNSNSITVATLLTIGTCWPSSCSIGEAANVTSRLLGKLIGGSSGHWGLFAEPAAFECAVAGAPVRLTGGAIAMITILSIIGACLVAGTAIDLLWVSNNGSNNGSFRRIFGPPTASSPPLTVDGSTSGDEEDVLVATTRPEIGQDNSRPPAWLGTLRDILLCFSVRTNAGKILSQRSADHRLSCVNGIRFLSMSWVILGHTYVLGLMSASNLAAVGPKWLNRWTFQAILNATVSVDTFFVLSGFLAAYLFLREADIRGGQLRRINWLRFYLHRYWRLTAPYMIILGAYTSLAQLLYDGPRYPRDGFDANCERTWWHNLLYINNMFNFKDMCMAWSWYLANDMQFYVVSPLVLVPMALKPALGAVLAALAIVGSAVATGVHSTLAGLPAGELDADDAASNAYIRPWFRLGPYLVGSLAGLAAHRLLKVAGDRRRALRLRWPVRLLGWAVAAGLCLSVVYGLYDVERGRRSLSQPVASLYNATFRLAWSLGVAWLVLACATGNGGWPARLLSAGPFAPLSRLSYCAYLIHPVLMAVVEAARRDTVQWNEWTPVGRYFAYLMGSYLAAFVASLALESPLIGLERLATGGRQ